MYKLVQYDGFNESVSNYYDKSVAVAAYEGAYERRYLDNLDRITLWEHEDVIACWHWDDDANIWMDVLEEDVMAGVYILDAYDVEANEHFYCTYHLTWGPSGCSVVRGEHVEADRDYIRSLSFAPLMYTAVITANYRRFTNYVRSLENQEV